LFLNYHLKISQNRVRINRELFSETTIDTETTAMIAHLTVCIDELKNDEKELVEMHLQGFNNTEISEKLNLSEKTVRNKLSLTRKSLSKLWHQLVVIIALLWN
jgi:DNA-directed RNA polymerase specialized sigma24 family protein